MFLFLDWIFTYLIIFFNADHLFWQQSNPGSANDSLRRILINELF